MCKLQRVTHKPYITPFGLYSVCERFVGVYTSIKSTKIKLIPIINWPANEILVHITYEPRQEISNNVVCATIKASDQPAHTRSLIRAFASRLNILCMFSY